MRKSTESKERTPMSQRSFASAEYAMKKKRTRREKFLGEMERIVPWARLIAVIEPLYPTSGRVGRQPIGVPTMLRMYCLQQWYGLADEALEDALYDSQALRDFVGIDLSRQSVPDATTLLKFRHLLQDNNLTRALFDEINAHLGQKGLLMRAGTIVDATIIAAPSSTKNEGNTRDPEMHQTKKGNQWHFGMKAHIGVDADSGLVHTVATTAANEADVEVVHELLHGKEQVVHADSGYTGADKRVQRKKLEWQIAARRGKIKAIADGSERRKLEKIEQRKASVRAKVEHPFRVIKRQFGLMKVRFRGLAKNTAHVITLFALSNLWMARRRLLAMTG